MDDYAKTQIKGHTLLATLVLLFGFAIYGLTYMPPLYRNDYSGYVIEKSMRFTESKNGNGLRWELVVGDLHGNQFRVRVNEEVFRKVQPGAYIEKRASDNEPSINP